jgi:PTH1 family peptidyl-tRNA hydrolase
MGLFTRKPIELRQNLPYRVSFTEKTKLVISLGNPGKKYDLTRHNMGFAIADQFAIDNDFGPWRDDKKFKGRVTEKTLGSCRVILLKPATYMNLSGESAQAVASFYKIELGSIAAIYDDLSIPFGQIRTRVGGQAGGHNGVKSLIEHLGSDFGRIKIGTGNELLAKLEATDFVLTKFAKTKKAVLPELLKEAGAIITEFIYGDSLPPDTRRIDVGR